MHLMCIRLQPQCSNLVMRKQVQERLSRQQRQGTEDKVQLDGWVAYRQMPYLEALRPEMRPSVSEVPLVPWLPLVGLLGMPAMILPPLPCSSSLGLRSHTGVMRSQNSMHSPGQLQGFYDRVQ